MHGQQNIELYGLIQYPILLIQVAQNMWKTGANFILSP